MPDSQKELAVKASCKRVLDLLEDRRKERDVQHGPAWARTTLSSSESLPGATLVFSAIFFLMAMAGLSHHTMEIALGLGILLVSLWIMMLPIAGVVCFFAWFLAKKPGRTAERSPIDDCIWMERLAVCSKRALKSIHHARHAERERSREAQTFVFGALAKVSPFLVLLMVLAPQAETIAVIKQVKPSLAPLLSHPLITSVVIFLATVLSYVRILAHTKDTAKSIDLMLLSGALDLIDAGETPSGGSEPGAAQLTEDASDSEDDVLVPAYAAAVTTDVLSDDPVPVPIR